MADEEEPKPGAKIIRLPERKPAKRIEESAEGQPQPADIRTSYGGKHCGHRAKFIHPNTRSVSCQDCSCSLDVFETLQDWVRTREGLICQEKHMREQISELSAELEELKRQVRNAKAQLNRAEKKGRPKPPEKGKVFPWPIKD